MKFIITGFIALVFCSLTTAQKILGSQLPKAVTATFIQKFPDVRRETWRKQGVAEYKANFILNDAKTSTLINEQGEVLKTETKIKISALPEQVTSGIKAKYPTAKFIAASKIHTAKDSVRYKADIKTGKKNFDVLFSENGEFIKS